MLSRNKGRGNFFVPCDRDVVNQRRGNCTNDVAKASYAARLKKPQCRKGVLVCNILYMVEKAVVADAYDGEGRGDVDGVVGDMAWYPKIRGEVRDQVGHA